MNLISDFDVCLREGVFLLSVQIRYPPVVDGVINALFLQAEVFQKTVGLVAKPV